MRDLKISLCQHPTTVVFIDDNQDYLTNLHSVFNEILPCITFSSPHQALHYLNETYQHSSFVSRYVVSPEDEEQDQLSSNLDVRTLRNEALLPNRFEEIAVVVVDYTMPSMNGIELCKLVKNRNIRVILLTGDADYDIAIREFNNGTINKYFKKATPNLMDELLQAIYGLEKQYFINQSSIILSNTASHNNFKFLEDTKIADIFYQICRDNNIVEHYILNDKGSFLLVDKYGKPRWFTVLEESELLDNFYNTAENGPAPESVLTALKNKTKIPFFYTEEDTIATLEQWEQYLYPATCLKTDRTYYYAYIPELKTYDSQTFQTLSYQDYLAKF